MKKIMLSLVCAALAFGASAEGATRADKIRAKLVCECFDALCHSGVHRCASFLNLIYYRDSAIRGWLCRRNGRFPVGKLRKGLYKRGIFSVLGKALRPCRQLPDRPLRRDRQSYSLVSWLGRNRGRSCA